MAIQTDASGYLPPDFDLPELEICLQIVQNRFRYVSPAFAQFLQLPINVADTVIAGQIQRLTLRQKEFLRLVCTGLFQKEIAGAMGITKETVVSYKKDLTRKLQLDSRRDLRYFLAPYSHLLGVAFSQSPTFDITKPPPHVGTVGAACCSLICFTKTKGKSNEKTFSNGSYWLNSCLVLL